MKTKAYYKNIENIVTKAFDDVHEGKGKIGRRFNPTPTKGDWKEELAFPKKYSYESKDYPKWLRFEGICEHDDGFFCEHRHKYVFKVISNLLKEAYLEGYTHGRKNMVNIFTPQEGKK